MNPSLELVRGRTFTALALLSALISGLLLVVLSATTAQAGGVPPGGDSGSAGQGGTGGDGCLILGWERSRSVSDINLVHGANGASCGNPDTIQEGLTKIAPGCWNNRRDLVAIFWTVDQDDSWATSNNHGQDTDLQTKRYVREMIEATPDNMWKTPSGNLYEFNGIKYRPNMLRAIAQASVRANTHNVVVCAWVNSTSPFVCEFLPEWGDYVAALPGSAVMSNVQQAERRCFQSCPRTSAQNAGERIPIAYSSPSARAAFCNPPITDDWYEYAWGSELGYGIPQVDSAGGVHPYVYYTTLQDGGKAVKGQKAFESSTDWKLSAFGEFYNEWCGASEGCKADDSYVGNNSEFVSDFKAAYNEALSKMESESHASLDMNANQKAALAQGRVVNVTDSQSYAYAYITESVDKYYKRQCFERTYYDLAGDEWNTTTECTAWDLAPEAQGDRHYVDYEYMQTYASPEVTQAYQVLTTHCNSNEFNSLNGRVSATVARDGSGTLNSGDNSNYYSASTVSGVYSSVAQLPWGGLNPTSVTNRPKFFDRLCSYQGTLSNPVNNQPVNERERSKWNYFRDGEWNPLELNYFTPSAQGVVRYNGEDPIATHLARDPDGTPDTDLMNFRAFDGQDGRTEEVFRPNDDEVPTQRQWMGQSEQEHLSDNVALVPGNYTTWEAWGTWASSQRLPQVLQARWKFEPEVTMNSATRNVGFGNAFGAISWEPETVRTRVAGMVESVHDSSTSYSDPTLKSQLMASTGTGNEPTMETPLFWGSAKGRNGEWNREPADFDGHYYSVRWVRAVSE